MLPELYIPTIAGACMAADGESQFASARRGLLRSLTEASGDRPHEAAIASGATLLAGGFSPSDLAGCAASIDDSRIVLNGELYGAPRKLSQSANGSTPGHSQAPALVLQGYLEGGNQFLAGLEGRFVAAIWDARRQQCVLLNDKFGSMPLYFIADDRQFAFASRIRTLLGLPQLRRRLSTAGLVQFFTFGHLWNQDTLLAEIHCMPPATVVVFEQRTSALRQESYWRPKAARREDAPTSLTQIDAALKTAIDERTTGADHLGMSLSGGLDARTLLGVMDCSRTPTTCVSLGMEGSLDQRSARQLAELAGCRYQTLVLDQRFLADFDRHLRNMADLTDGHYLSQCIVMPTLPLYAELGIRTLLRGHVGELVHMHKAYNFSVDATADRISTEQELEEWLLARLQSHLTDGVDERLLCGIGQAEFADVARDSLRTSLAATANWDHPVDRISQLFLDQRTRRETAMSLVKFSSVVTVRLPYLDGRFVESVFAAPPALRIGDEIQTYILRKRRPEFLRPANSNTGAPVGVGALRKAFAYQRMRVLAKLGVPGYQPYERLGLWLRRELKPIVERILLSQECLERGVFEPDAVRNVIRRHASGQCNHTYLLMAMMILETGFRQLLDPAGALQAESAARAASV